MILGFTTYDHEKESFNNEIAISTNGNGSFSTYQRIINIHISAQNISMEHLFSTTNSLCIMYVDTDNGWTEYARSEVQWGRINPSFIKPFTVAVHPNEPQLLLFELYNLGSKSKELKSQEFIGDCELDLHNLLESSSNQQKLELRTIKNLETHPFINVKYVDVDTQVYGSFLFNMSAHCNRHDGIFKPNLYFVIHRQTRGKRMIPVYKSPIQHHVMHCKWNNLEIPHNLLCGEDLSEKIKISVFDFSQFSHDGFIGHFETTAKDLISKGNNKFRLHKLTGEYVGDFVVSYVGHINTPRVDDFMLKDIRFNLMLGVDFSMTVIPGIYRSIINIVIDSLSNITRNSSVIAYGFGGSNENQMFSFDCKKHKTVFKNPIKVLNAYDYYVTETYGLPHKPKLCQFIEHAKHISREKWIKDNSITIAVIITDSRIDDINETINSIISCDYETICFLFITVSDKDAILNQKLKGKHGKLESNGKESTRRVAKVITYLKHQMFNAEQVREKTQSSTRKLLLKLFEKNNNFNLFE